MNLGKSIEKKKNLKQNFGAFASNHINHFISFHDLMKKQNAKCPFMILNIGRSDKIGTHWWSILDLHLKKRIFLFDFFGLNIL